MIINFKNVTIENFQSIRKAKVELSGQGVVLIKGINLYESKTNSNGSGKSSIAESIIYAIFGKTSKGISSCSNRYSNDECKVILEFDVDNNSYKIIRGEKGKKHTGYVEFYCNEENITARNKSDTDKVIVDTFPVSKDIFLSTIFLSQTFSGKLSALTPSGRKDRLEQITNTESKLNEFKDKLSKLKSNYTEKYNSSLRDVSYADGKISFIESQISSTENNINNIENEISNLKNEEDIDVEIIKNKIKSIEDNINKINDLSISTKENLDILNDKINKKNIEIATDKSRCSYLKNEIESLKNGKKCPTCGHILVGSASAEVIKDKENELKEVEVRYRNLNESNKPEIENRDILSNKGRELNNKLSQLNQLLSMQNNILNKAIQKTSNINSKEEKIVELKNSIVSLNENKLNETNSKNEANEKANENEMKASISNHCLQLVTKQFRNHLLDETINYMNELLKEYSAYLFDNDVINLVSDGSKLDIYLGDALYESCSGGEQKKIDVALVLCQRELGININGLECNLIIMDEIMENMDETAVNSSTDLILEKCPAESMFIISHNNYSLPYDRQITVVKGKDRCSTIQ